ncbi:heparinase II/III family protein [Eggerthella sp. YY7918]|uniref:heparinase II/III family protein n=1 Tax=Eggerthella sp. (strain YY7918) TaxID=502558 RepID=UPI0002170FCF|nr:heparinase II/III family protein [Eggerthella sp. YY7918]BAK43911.1 hypothetical protein EGYY_07140 [Eggerthella sp. YY7918]
MGVLNAVRLRVSTALHLKPSQIAYRVWRRLGGKTPLKVGYAPRVIAKRADISRIPVLPELDYDPVFLARFDCDAILGGEMRLLHHAERIDWGTCWREPLATPLWRFNLHYCEYLLPLAKRYADTRDMRYLDAAKAIVLSWIGGNPEGGGGDGWSSYTIAMRTVNWLAFYGELRDELAADGAFTRSFNDSLAAQYRHLATHLEKDLLANHYLEDLKALVLGALFFGDEETLSLALPLLEGEVEEQILADGMHFELSPMYHKIVLEDLLRVAVALRANGRPTVAIEERLQLMCDCLYSMERNANRTPLFNDSGDNVAKHKDALLACARRCFGVEPRYREDFPDAGYYLMERTCAGRTVKVIFDAGQPGPRYAMGHAHCDALSFECFVDGEPWIVNCGTYAYQDELRLAFKSTRSHSTVMTDGQEHSECWAPFRVARFGRPLETCHESETFIINAKFVNYRKTTINRIIALKSDKICVHDRISQGALVSTFIYSQKPPFLTEGKIEIVNYSPDFGSILPAWQAKNRFVKGDGFVEIPLYETFPLVAKRRS